MRGLMQYATPYDVRWMQEHIMQVTTYVDLGYDFDGQLLDNTVGDKSLADF